MGTFITLDRLRQYTSLFKDWVNNLSKWNEKKNVQSAVSSPSASGNALAFIDTINQNEQGVISVTKKSVTVDATPTANSTNPVASGGVKATMDGKKNTQTAVSSPTASGNALAFIDTISQNEQGVITPTKKTVQSASQSQAGLMSAADKANLDQLMNAYRTVIYGFHIDSSESDPASAVTYVADAVGMTPAHMDYTKGVFDYGSWGNAFFMPRPCMLKYDGTVDYYLDPNDYSKKETGGASDVANDAYGGNAMMEWGQNGKKIWYKIVPDADPTSATVYIADYQADADFRAWSFINSAGQMKAHFYTPIYNGWSDGSSRMRSISGKTPTASLNAQAERDRCRANNSSLAIWDTEVFADNILITLLLILMGKNLNTQAVFGQGCTTPGQAGVLNTGTGDALGLFYGYSDTTKVVKVFGMENFWGNLWRRFGGLVNDNGTCRYKLTRGTQDGSGASDYVISAASADYAAYHQGGAIPAGTGSYVSRMLFNAYMFAPYAVGSDAAHHYCDAFWSHNAQVDYASRGGYAVHSSRCGAWYLGLHGPASYAVWYVAAAPSCKPL